MIREEVLKGCVQSGVTVCDDIGDAVQFGIFAALHDESIEQDARGHETIVHLVRNQANQDRLALRETLFSALTAQLPIYLHLQLLQRGVVLGQRLEAVLRHKVDQQSASERVFGPLADRLDADEVGAEARQQPLQTILLRLGQVKAGQT